MTFDDPDHFPTRSASSRSVRPAKGVILFACRPRRGSRYGSFNARPATKLKPMPTKNLESSVADELRPEYDLASLKGGVRGKYYARATAGTTMVLLEPDVAEAFSDGASVNQSSAHVHRERHGASCLTRRCSRRAGRRADQNRSARSRLAAERRSARRMGPARGGVCRPLDIPQKNLKTCIFPQLGRGLHPLLRGLTDPLERRGAPCEAQVDESPYVFSMPRW